MQTICILTTDDMDSNSIHGYAKCPECGRWQEIPKDYVSHPIIFCKCGIFVLDVLSRVKKEIDLEKEYREEKEFLKNKNLEKDFLVELLTILDTEKMKQGDEFPCYGEYCYEGGRGVDYEFYQINICYILKVQNSRMMDAKFDSNVKNSDYFEKEKIISDFLFAIREKEKEIKGHADFKILKAINFFGIKFIDENENVETKDEKEKIEYEILVDREKGIDAPFILKETQYKDFDVYLQVNSYNLLKPKNTYVEPFVIDSCCFHLICRNCTGNEFLVTCYSD